MDANWDSSRGCAFKQDDTYNRTDESCFCDGGHVVYACFACSVVGVRPMGDLDGRAMTEQ